jgi:hypothetical protein
MVVATVIAVACPAPLAPTTRPRETTRATSAALETARFFTRTPFLAFKEVRPARASGFGRSSGPVAVYAVRDSVSERE